MDNEMMRHPFGPTIDLRALASVYTKFALKSGKEIPVATYIKALVTIYSSDIQRAATFYGNILGLPETYRFPKAGAPMHIEYSIGGTTVAVSSPEGLKSHGMPPASAGHPFEIGLKTENLDEAMAELRAAGVTILKEPAVSEAGNKYAYIADPDGTWISLYQNIEG
ncbi:MAG: VOC family protein [Caldilineaceae bacterium]